MTAHSEKIYCKPMAFNPLTTLFGSKRERDVKDLIPRLHAVNEREDWAMSLAAADFLAKTAEFRARIASGEALESSQQLQASALDLSRLSEQLRSLVGRFKV